MIFTLGVNAVMRGLMVAHTGGFAPQTAATAADERTSPSAASLGIPIALFVWAARLGRRSSSSCTRTPFGRYVYAIGNREARRLPRPASTPARCWSAPSRSAACAPALAGVLLAGYSTKAYQGMGDAYLLPAIAAVVIGGTHILGGRGRYLGTVVGVDPDRAPQLRAVDHADARGRPAGHLRPRDHRHAAGLRPRGAGDGVEFRELYTVVSKVERS